MNLDLSDPAQRRKALLIPVLIAGLGYVLLSGEEASTPREKAPRDKVADQSADPQPVLDLPTRAVRQWTSMTLDSVLAHNPFARPRPAPRPPAEAPRPPIRPEPSATPQTETNPLHSNVAESESATSPTEPDLPRPPLPPLEVIMIYHGPDGPAAVLGTQQIIRVGDLLEGYGKVLEIAETGIRIQPLNSH